MQRIIAILVLFLSAGLATIHPQWPAAQCIVVLAMAALTARSIRLWPTAFPILLILADAYPWTGQLVLAEYDSLLGGGLAGWLWSSKGEVTSKQNHHRKDHILMGVVVLLIASVVISFLNGILKLPTVPWGDQLSTYFTYQNSIRIAKGYVWGDVFLACTMIAYRRSIGRQWLNDFALGAKITMLVVGLMVVAERATFESLFQWDREYRATGPFYSMHIGDQHIDAFLAMVLPFLWIHEAESKRLSMTQWISSVVLTLLLIYATLGTMSRATYFAIAMEVTIGAILLLVPSSTMTLRKGGALLVIPPALAAGFLALVAVAPAFAKRFESLVPDLEIRRAHWLQSTAPLAESLPRLFLGNGMGTVPTLLAKSKGLAVPPLQWQSERGGQIVLQGGWPLYLEQFRFPRSIQTEEFSFRIESLDQRNELHVFRCRKSMLHSYEKVDTTEVIAPGQTKEDATIQLGPLPITVPRWSPESLGFHLGAQGKVVLSDSSSQSLGAKPDFVGARSSSPWCFTCDDHLVWRTKNFLVHLLCEQGLVGVAAWMLLLSVSLIRSIACPERRKIVVGLFGFFLVGMFGTLVDTPSLLGFQLACLSLLVVRNP
jgi:hypothetical protein